MFTLAKVSVNGMNRPMSRNHPNPRDPAILHLHIRLKPFGHSLGDDGALVLLQRVDLGLDVSGEGINLGAFGVEVGGNAALLLHGRNYNMYGFNICFI